MQQLTVQNQADFLKLQPLAPQEKSFGRNDSFLVSASKKSFSDFVNEAKMSAEKSEQAGKTENSAQIVSVNEEKTENFAETAESKKEELKTESQDEKKNLAVQKKTSSEEKKTGKENVSSVAKDVNFEETENSKKTASAEKKSDSMRNSAGKTIKKSENKNPKKEKELENSEKAEKHFETEDFALQNSLSSSEKYVAQKNEKNEADEFNPRLSDFSDEDSEKIGSAGMKTAKTSFLDKEQKIVVHDFRTENSDNSAEPKQEKKSAEILEIRRDENNNPELTMDFAAKAQQNITSSSSQAASSSGSDFQAMLSNQIQENAGEIVKAGNIVLKDNDVGSIKLILHPESLGNVRIDLHLDEKNISGKIIVASQEAFNAFKETAENLKQAFAQSGFDSVGLELSLAERNFGGNNSGGNHNNPAAEFAMRKVYGEFNGFSGDEISEMEIIENSSRNSVNIVA